MSRMLVGIDDDDQEVLPVSGLLECSSASRVYCSSYLVFL
jgi:hypothetical protein